MIGRALGKDKLLSELRNIKDNEVRSLLLGMEEVTNVVHSYTAEMEKCDAKIASIFGGKNAIASANGFEPESLAIIRMRGGNYDYYRGDTYRLSNDGTKIIGQGHLSRYIMHLYGSTDGTRFGVDGNTLTDIYVPDGFEMKSNTDWNGETKKDALKQIPTSKEAIVTFYYKDVGNVKDVTLLLMHVRDFNPKRDGNRWHIGKIGGQGGTSNDPTMPYLHSHFVLVKGDVGLAWKGKDTRAVSIYRETIGVRFVDAFC